MVGKKSGKPAKVASVSLLEDMRRGVEASETRYQMYARGMVHKANGESSITEEIDEPEQLRRMERLVKRIEKKDEDAVHMSTGKGLLTYGHLIPKLTSLGTAVLDVCMDIIPMIEMAYPGCRLKTRSMTGEVTEYFFDDPYRLDDLKVIFNPYLTVMLRACQKAMPWLVRGGGKSLDLSDQRAVKALNHLLRFARRVCRSKRFKSINNDYRHCARENLRSCCKFMATKFADYSRLLILRVELYIAPEFKAWAMTDAGDHCVRRFRRALREKRIVPDVVAWICKREFGFRRGMHCHVLVAMDGHKHKQAEMYARMIGEAWQHRFSDGHGTYYNCWSRRTQYSLNCLGLVHVSDRMMLLGLREAIRYITKTDCLVVSGYPRDLWKGIDRGSWRGAKRGAPRKAQHDLALVNEILRRA
jgi:hypothetical protein